MEITKKPLTTKLSVPYEKKKPLTAKLSAPTSTTVSPIVTTKLEEVALYMEHSGVTDPPYPNRAPRVRMGHSFTLIWLDSSMDPQVHPSLDQLRRIVNQIDLFRDVEQCVDFLGRIKESKAFMIVSENLAQSVVPLVHAMSHLESIYAWGAKEPQDEQWAHEWTKVKGSFREIDVICRMLEQDTRQCDRDAISISVNSSNLNRLDPSFMYTQILKEILLEQSYDPRERADFVQFYREQNAGNADELLIIDEFERDYHSHSPIWWYTRECFIYRMINSALRAEDFEVIIRMGFFLRDVHRQIQELHRSTTNHYDPFTVYRGQGISSSEFTKIRDSDGGLLAFNSFLSTSLSERISSRFAREALCKPDSVGVLFEMTIDPSILSTSFARVAGTGFFSDAEKEILFSMHTVFRIGQIEQIQERVWRVKLSSANENDDLKLKRLIGRVREETQGRSTLHRLCKLLTKAAKFAKAEEVCQILIKDTSQDKPEELARLYQQLGYIKKIRNDHPQALTLYQQALEIQLQCLSSTHLDLAETHQQIGSAYDNMGKYSLALPFYQKSLDIGGVQHPVNRGNLATIHNSMGAIYLHRKEYFQALESYKKALENEKKSLPSYHPNLILTYNNIGLAHRNMTNYPKALEFHYRALKICEKSPTENQPMLVNTYRNLSLAHRMMQDYPKALKFLHRVIEVEEKSLAINHLFLGSTYRRIGSMHFKMHEHAKALEYYLKTLDIYQVYLPRHHVDLASIHSQIARVYETIDDPVRAVSFYEQAIQLGQQSSCSNDPCLQLWQKRLAKIQERVHFLPMLSKK